MPYDNDPPAVDSAAEGKPSLDAEGVRASVQTYYGQTLSSSEDLKTSACCSLDEVPAPHREILGQIEPEVLERFYGCGSPIPTTLEGKAVLDLGCGTGRDVFLAAKLAGLGGRVIGVDMTEEQLAVGRKHLAAMTEKLGLEPGAIELRQGLIEDLAAAGVEDASVDVVISNCVINLSPDKPRVLAEIFRVLKPGGELYFSDVFADRRIPLALQKDETLYGECLAGAMYLEDFRRTLSALGCPDPRVVSSRRLTVDDPALAEKTGPIRFVSSTVRAFKLASLEDRCEDYGQTATYRGGVPEMPEAFVLDDHHKFPKGEPVAVCGNTAAMLEETRLGAFFDVKGDRSEHRGLFDCGPSATSCEPSEAKPASSCC